MSLHATCILSFPQWIHFFSSSREHHIFHPMMFSLKLSVYTISPWDLREQSVIEFSLLSTWNSTFIMVRMNTCLFKVWKNCFILSSGTKQESVWLLIFSLWDIITSGVRLLGLNSALLAGSPWTNYLYLSRSGQEREYILKLNAKPVYKAWAGSEKVTRDCAVPWGWFLLGLFTTLKPEGTSGGGIYLETKRTVQREGNHDLGLSYAPSLLCFCRGECWGRNRLPSGLPWGCLLLWIQLEAQQQRGAWKHIDGRPRAG